MSCQSSGSNVVSTVSSAARCHDHDVTSACCVMSEAAAATFQVFSNAELARKRRCGAAMS